MSSPFKVFTKKERSVWENDFEMLRRRIVADSSKQSANYSHNRMDINKLDEVTVLYINGRIVAFSSLFQSPFYPKNVARAFNRTWKSTSIRWQKPAYHTISKLMLQSQLDMAYKIGYDFVFLSAEGPRHNYWRRWKDGADKDFPEWVVHPGMVQVCSGPYDKCWQSIVYKSLKCNPSIIFPMKSISLMTWKSSVRCS